MWAAQIGLCRVARDLMGCKWRAWLHLLEEGDVSSRSSESSPPVKAVTGIDLSVPYTAQILLSADSTRKS